MVFRFILNLGIFDGSTGSKVRPSVRQKSVIIASLRSGSGSGSGSGSFFLPFLPFLEGGFFSSTGGNFSGSLVYFACFLIFSIAYFQFIKLASFCSSFFSDSSGSSSAVDKLNISLLFFLNIDSISANFLRVLSDLLRNMIIYISFCRGK